MTHLLHRCVGIAVGCDFHRNLRGGWRGSHTHHVCHRGAPLAEEGPGIGRGEMGRARKEKVITIIVTVRTELRTTRVNRTLVHTHTLLEKSKPLRYDVDAFDSIASINASGHMLVTYPIPGVTQCASFPVSAHNRSTSACTASRPCSVFLRERECERERERRDNISKKRGSFATHRARFVQQITRHFDDVRIARKRHGLHRDQPSASSADAASCEA